MGGASYSWIAACISGMLVTGTLNTLCTKYQFELTSIGKDGKPELFQKPFFATFNMMFSMLIVGSVDKLVRMARARGKLETPLLADESPATQRKENGSEQKTYFQKAVMVTVPAVFDIGGTALTTGGVMFIPASVWQMLRGSAIVFAAIMSVLFLKRKMYAFNYLGLSLCVFGVGLVGVAQVAGGSSAAGGVSMDDSMSTFIGMGLVVAGQVVQAGQLVAEEFIMREVDLPAMQIIGWEGFWGTLLMIFLVYPLLWIIPGKDFGHTEDVVDTFTLINNNPELLAVVLTFLFSCGTFNATGIAVTESLSAVHRLMLDATRTVLVWALCLWVHYCVSPSSPFGEVLTSWSVLQLLGFVAMVCGQAIYGEVLKVPGMRYPKQDPMKSSSPSALRLNSPLPREA